jgi:hypothetical protein
MMMARTAAITIIKGHKNLATRIQMYDRYSEEHNAEGISIHLPKVDHRSTPLCQEASNISQEKQLTLDRANMLITAAAATPIPIPP